ncbi:MAG: site-specific integrase, partial [Eudoraea sp.]
MSLAAFIEYLSLEKKYSMNTVKAYEKDLGDFALFCKEEMGEENIERIPYNYIRNWIIHLIDQGVINRSVNRKVSSLKAFYKFLLKTETIQINPLA